MSKPISIKTVNRKSRAVFRKLAGPGKARGFMFVGVFVVIGTALLLAAHAANQPAAFPASPQSGTLTSPASLVADPTAVGQQAVRFGQAGGSASCGLNTKSTSPPSGSSYGTNALQLWNCALTNRGSRPVTWVAWGDSVVEGEGSKTVAGRWIDQVLSSLRSTYPTSGVTGGFGYLPSFYGTYGVSDPNSAWNIQPQTSGSATWNLDGNQLGSGPGLGLRTVTVKSGGSIKFKVSGTSADIMYNYGSGSFSYKVDSGSATTVSTSGGSGAAGTQHVTYPSAGSHTITVTGVSGSVIVEGVMEYNGDENRGIRLYEGGQCSLTTGDFMNQLPALAAITAKVNPDLVTIDLSGNDYGDGSPSPSQTEANLKSMVQSIRSAATGHEPSIVIMLTYENPNDSRWQQYMSAVKAVTTADPTLGFLDMTSFANAANGTDGGLLTSDGHPADPSGQAKFAAMVESYLEDE